MTTPKRVQSGVPTGGQFASSGHDESEVELHTCPDGPTDEDRALVAVIDASGQAAAGAESLIQLASAKALARGVLRQWPSATYLRLDAYQSDSYPGSDGHDPGEVLTEQDRTEGAGACLADLNDADEPLSNGEYPSGLAANLRWDGDWEAFADADEDDGSVRCLRLREAADMELPGATPTPEQTQAALDDLVARHFGGNAVQAMLALAGSTDIAVNYQNRDTFEGSFGPLADDEWQRITPHLDSYDEFMDNSGAAESIACWRDVVLTRAKIDDLG